MQSPCLAFLVSCCDLFRRQSRGLFYNLNLYLRLFFCFYSKNKKKYSGIMGGNFLDFSLLESMNVESKNVLRFLVFALS